MKFTKLSLVAAIAVSSAFAGGDIAPVEPAPVVEVSPWSFSGDAKLYYSTQSSTPGASIFDKEASTGQAAISGDLGYAINDNWKVNVGMTGLMTLGLDDSVVNNVWLYAGADVEGLGMTSIGDALWFDTANITGTMFDGALTMVLGRQELDTPLAFSEKWNIAPNTFDAAVAIAKPMENLSLIAAYIYDGNGNGERISTFDSHPGGFTGNDGYLPIPGVADSGAWTVAAVATFAGVTAQAWYYEVTDVADAVWLQADGNFAGFTLGAQYAWMGATGNLEDLIPTLEDTSAWAIRAGYEFSGIDLWAAYSSVDDDGDFYIGNTATMLNGAGSVWGAAPAGFGWQAQSKLYTEAWWNYGNVGANGADTFAAGASYNMGDLAVFNGISASIQYTGIKDAGLIGNDGVDINEVATVVGAKVYGLDAKIAYIWNDENDYGVDMGSTDTVQLYLTYNF